MKSNMQDFVYEQPEQIRQRKRAMDYYHRCLRIKQAKQRAAQSNDVANVSEPVTIEFAQIEKAIVKLQRKFRLSYRATEHD